MANDPILGNGVMRGVDGSGNTRNVAVDSSGNLTVTASGGGDAVTIADGADVAQGTTTDASTANTVIGRLKKIIALLPTALGAHGGLVVEGVASGVAVPVSFTTTRPSTGAETNVASSASSVTVLASNANRLGASVVNDSTAILYLLLVTGGTASTTVYTIALPGTGSVVVPAYYEVPFGYTGAIIGIWASANGSARVTEYTA